MELVSSVYFRDNLLFDFIVHVMMFLDLHSLRGHKGPAIRSIDFFPMDGYLATTSVDCTIKVNLSN